MVFGGFFCRGIVQDVYNRIEHYKSDWPLSFEPKILSSTLFTFLTSIGPAITFSLLLSTTTDNDIGTIEVLLSSALAGCLMSVFAGQPLVIVGVTGPVSILTASIYMLAKQMNLKFLPFYAWSQLWAAGFHVILAVCNSCDLVKFVTRYSCESFGVLIALIYLETGFRGIIEVLLDMDISFSSSLVQFIISVFTATLSYWFCKARHWRIGSTMFRNFFADYSTTLAIVICSTIPLMAEPRLEGETVPCIFIPLKFGTTSGRPWLVDLSDIPVWGGFAAIIPGIIITLLFYFDHNISSLMAQSKDFNLKKPPAYHLDFLMLGVTVFLTGILGFPPCNGLIPQAPLHTKSLATRTHVHNAEGKTIETVHVLEQRWSNFLQSLLCLIVAIPPFCQVVRSIPNAALYGLFLFMGAVSFEGNEFTYRMFLLAIDPLQRNARKYAWLGTLSMAKIARFTAMQAAACFLIFYLTFTPVAIIFPVLICALVLIRLYVLPRYVDAETLQQLDPLHEVQADVEEMGIEEEEEQEEGKVAALGEVELVVREVKQEEEGEEGSQPMERVATAHSTADSSSNL